MVDRIAEGNDLVNELKVGGEAIVTVTRSGFDPR